MKYTPKCPDAAGRLRVLFPEKGEVVKTPIGQITLHGCESFGLAPLSKAEEKVAKSAKYKDWPRKRVEMFLCMERLKRGEV